MPSSVSRVIGGNANMIVAMTPALEPTPKNIATRIKYEKWGNDCKTLRMGHKRCSMRRCLAAMMPKVKPMMPASGAETDIAERVCIDKSQIPRFENNAR